MSYSVSDPRWNIEHLYRQARWEVAMFEGSEYPFGTMGINAEVIEEFKDRLDSLSGAIRYANPYQELVDAAV
jgi:hypothetical protein